MLVARSCMHACMQYRKEGEEKKEKEIAFLLFSLSNWPKYFISHLEVKFQGDISSFENCLLRQYLPFPTREKEVGVLGRNFRGERSKLKLLPTQVLLPRIRLAGSLSNKRDILVFSPTPKNLTTNLSRLWRRRRRKRLQNLRRSNVFPLSHRFSRNIGKLGRR